MEETKFNMIINMLIQQGYTNVQKGEYTDITATNSKGESVAIFLATPKRYHNKELLRNREYALINGFDKWYCLCDMENYNMLRNLVGEAYIMRLHAVNKHYNNKIESKTL